MLKYAYVIAGCTPRCERHACLRELAASACCPASSTLGDEVGRHGHVVELALLEREQARIRFLDDADLDAPDRAAACGRRACATSALVGRRRCFRIALVAKARIRLEHDPLRRAATP